MAHDGDAPRTAAQPDGGSRPAERAPAVDLPQQPPIGGASRRPRGDLGVGAAIFWGVTCVAAVVAVWFFVTAGEGESRLVSPATLPSPLETARALPRVLFERRLVANTLVTLSRVASGFGLAAVVGVPLGVLAACFPSFRAFLAPLTIFGRNIPVAALIPLTFFLFGIGEFQKVMFLFVASVAFIVTDAAAAVREVPERYVETALTLGASRLQIILKVLVPLAAPAIFNSLRLLFGLAFGYVMLAELVKFGSDSGGLGDLINVSQRRGEREPIMLVLVIIPLVAYCIDRVLWWLQCDLFPYRYGGRGFVPGLVRAVMHPGRSRRTGWRP